MDGRVRENHEARPLPQEKNGSRAEKRNRNIEGVFGFAEKSERQIPFLQAGAEGYSAEQGQDVSVQRRIPFL
jgi:hypothetical protein